MSLGPDADISGRERSSRGDLERASTQHLKTGWVRSEEMQAPSACVVQTQPNFDWLAADAYLFDIDGTLLNSRDAVHYHAFHRAVAEVFGLELRFDGIPVHGNTDVGILQAYLRAAGVPEEQWRPRMSEVFELMSAEVERNATNFRPELCPAIPELIDFLSEQGKLLGVASGNIERVGWAKLRGAGLRDHFSFGAFSGKHEKRDEVIAHGIEQAHSLRGQNSKIYVVGDTPADIHSAHANGIAAIAVATGIYGFDELLSHSPEMCVSCCTDLLNTFSSAQEP